MDKRIAQLAESIDDPEKFAELERLDELVAALKHYGRSEDYRDLIDWILRRFGH
jgi:HPt (histidine-containing phosphotransfer) domain-containing protein